jgi:hypothetical protein
LDAMVRHLLADISAYLEKQEQAPAKEDTESSAAIAPDELSALIDALRLRDGGAIRRYEANRAALGASLGAERAQRLQQAMDNLRIAEALQVLSSLKVPE